MSVSVVVDTNAWIDYFRSGTGANADAVAKLLEEENALLCGMVELEILQGLRKHERSLVRDLFRALDFVEATRQDFVLAGERLGDLRRKGITLPSSDCLIAAQCLNRDLPLLSVDKHFDHFPDVQRWR